MEQQAEAPPVFCSRPPASLGLQGDGKVDSDTVERFFQDEARNLQGRLREQLSQLRIELGLFLRLMYKNKNQHRRTLYYQRLSEVRRDMQVLNKSGLDETVENFPKLFTAKGPDGVSAKAVTQSKFKDAVDERKALRTLLCVARLLNQSGGPIMAGSAQLAGLLGQSFFMPFALTMFSCLARFRVLLLQVLYEVVAAFNLLSTFRRKMQDSLVYSVQGKTVSASVLDRSLPAELECQWDGAKLIMTEGKAASVPDCRTVADLPTESSPLWFVDDRTGLKCDLQVPTAIAGQSDEQPGVQSQLPLNANEGTIMVPEVERSVKLAPILEVRPDMIRPDPIEDVAGPSGEDFAVAKETSCRGSDVCASNLAFDLPTKPPMNPGGATGFSKLRDPSCQAQVNVTSSHYRHGPGASSASKKSVAYRSISRKIIPDALSSGKVLQNLQIGAKTVGADIGIVGQEERHEPLTVISSNHTARSSSDQGDDPLPGVVVENRAEGIPSIVAISRSSGSMEVVESGVPNEKPNEIELNQQSTIDSRQIGSVQVDTVAGTFGSAPTVGAEDTLRVSVENVSVIEDFGSAQMATSDWRSPLEHNVEKRSPEFRVANVQNEALVLESPHDNANRDGPIATEGTTMNDKSRVRVEGDGLDRNGGSDFPLNRSSFPDLPSSQSNNKDVSLTVREKVKLESNQVGKDATVNVYVQTNGPKNAGPEGSIAHPSICFTPVSLETRQGDPFPSGLDNAVESSNSFSEDSARKAPETYIPPKPNLRSHSNGKESRTGAVQEVSRCDDNHGSQSSRRSELEDVSEQRLGSTETASTPNHQQDAKRGADMAGAYVSIRSDPKAPQNKKEEDDAKRKETVSSQHLPRGRQKSPAKTKSKRGERARNDRSSESESKRKKTNDIFAMLLGGSD